MNHQIISRKTVFVGHAFNVEKLNVLLPDGRERSYDLVAHHDSVTIIPMDDEGNIFFVSQFRMGSESVLLELPAGVIDEGESPLECARREIREETGFAAGKLQELGAVYLAPGYSNELNHIFLATGLSTAPLDADEDEFLSRVKIAAEDVEKLIEKGELIDSKSITSLFFCRNFL